MSTSPFAINEDKEAGDLTKDDFKFDQLRKSAQSHMGKKPTVKKTEDSNSNKFGYRKSLTDRKM